MAFIRPTLPALIARIETDLVGRLQITATVLRRALVRIMARVWAGAVHGLHGHIEWAARQLFATTADLEYLELHGAELGVERKPADYAGGNVTFSGANDSIIPAATRLLRSDGVEYGTVADVTIIGGTATVAVLAVVAGANSNSDAGVVLSMISPIAGVTNSAVVAAGGITNGIDTESDDAYRDRILNRKRKPPQGGALQDYETWAREIAGVTRVWVYPSKFGPGTVGVTFVVDGEVSIIPDSGKVSEVQAYIDDPTRRPVTAQVEVYAPTAAPLNPEISITPDNADVRAAVIAQLTDLLYREGEPGGTLLLSHIDEAISAATGEEDHTLVSPSADVALDVNEIPTLGTVTWS